MPNTAKAGIRAHSGEQVRSSQSNKPTDSRVFSKEKKMMNTPTRWGKNLPVFLLTASMVLTGCGPAKQSEQPQPIKIGVIMPLTGGAASLGKACLNGMELAIA